MVDKKDYDLDAMSVQELTSLISDAESKRREKMEGAKAALIAEMEEKAAELGLSLEGLVRTSSAHAPAEATRGRKPRRDAGASVPAKFRGPNGEEWSGRGRPPSWLTALEADDLHRELAVGGLEAHHLAVPGSEEGAAER